MNKITPSGAPDKVQNSTRRRRGEVRRRRPQIERVGDFQRAVRAATKAYKKTGNLMDAALAYGACGVPVFPCSVTDKVPIAPKLRDANDKPIPNSGGHLRATTDPCQIREWWNNGAASYLIGVPAGPRSGVWLADIDCGPEHRVDGRPLWQALQDEHGPVVTREHRTPSDGLHVIFKYDPARPVRSSAGTLPAGVEVKGNGGYFIAPPSKRRGQHYRVTVDSKPQLAPQWLYDAIGQSKFYGDGDNPFLDFARDTADPAEITDALKWIPNEGPFNDWTLWKKVILAIERAVLDREQGERIADAWSRTNLQKYNQANQRKHWSEAVGSPAKWLGAQTIFKLAIENGWQCEPTYDAPLYSTVEAAGRKITDAVRKFLGLGAYNVFQMFAACTDTALRVTTGGRKSTIARNELAEYFRVSDEEAAELEEWEGKPVRRKHVVMLVQHHRLSKEVEQECRDLGIDTRIFRGRSADDPDNPGQKMCGDLDKVGLALAAHQDVESTCCKGPNGKCPLFDTCSYQKQPKEPARLMIAASDTLFHGHKSLGRPDRLLIDETFSFKAAKPEFRLPLASLKYGLKALDFLQPEDGGLRRDTLIDASTDEYELTENIRREWKECPKVELQPGMTKEQYATLDTAKLDEIAFRRKFIEAMREMRSLLRNDIETSGRLRLEFDSKLQQRVLVVSGTYEVAEQFRRVPTMMLDATLPDVDILRLTHPHVHVEASIDIRIPDHVTVRQRVIGAPTSQRKLIGDNDGDADLNDDDNEDDSASTSTSVEKHRQEIKRFILRRWMETGRGKTLVICQQGVKAWLRENLPNEIFLEHYKSTAGLNKYADVRLMVMVGRTQPGPKQIENLAGILTGEAPRSIVNPKKRFSWFHRIRRGIKMRGRNHARTVMGDFHPDAPCESIRWQSCEAELIQAFGRARAIHRTNDSPCDVDLLFATVLPEEVDEALSWQSQSLYIDTAHSDGVMLCSPVDMVKCWPNIFNLREAERTSKQGVPPLPNFTAFKYQLKGNGMKPRTAYVELARIPEPETWLAERLGPLKVVR